MAVWNELIVSGAEDVCRAFVAGFAAARRSGDAAVFGVDCHLAAESLGERVRALLARGSHHVVLAPARLAQPLAKAIRTNGAGVGLRLERCRTVKATWFAFRIEAYARDVATRLRRRLLNRLPAGIAVREFSEASEESPSAHGIELYSPAHEYVYRASGRIVGSPPAIFDVRERATKLDFVEVYELHAETTAR